MNRDELARELRRLFNASSGSLETAWLPVADYVLILIDQESHQRRERAKDAEARCAALERELAELKARGVDPEKARAAFGLTEMRDLAPAFVAWAREHISLGRLRECIQERMTHGKWEQTWPDDDVPTQSYGELATAHARVVAELTDLRSRPAEVLCGETLGPVTEEEQAAMGWDHREDGYEEAVEKFLAHRRANLPRVTVEELGKQLGDAIRQNLRTTDNMVLQLLIRLGRAVVVEQGEAPDPETQGRLDALRRELETTNGERNRARESAEKLAGHVRDLMAAVRVAEDWNEIEELAVEWS